MRISDSDVLRAAHEGSVDREGVSGLTDGGGGRGGSLSESTDAAEKRKARCVAVSWRQREEKRGAGGTQREAERSWSRVWVLGGERKKEGQTTERNTHAEAERSFNKVRMFSLNSTFFLYVYA